MEEDGRRGFDATVALKIARFVVPWIVLFVVVFVLVGVIGEYRAARESSSSGSSASTETSGSIDTTTSEDQIQIPVEPTDGAVSGGQTVVVQIEGLNMRTKPTTDSEVIKRLPLGARLTLIGESIGWYQVQDDAGDEGWVAAGGQYTTLE
jgi:uncharacterized protein YgiM (DUF1202 family)